MIPKLSGARKERLSAIAFSVAALLIAVLATLFAATYHVSSKAVTSAQVTALYFDHSSNLVVAFRDHKGKTGEVMGRVRGPVEVGSAIQVSTDSKGVAWLAPAPAEWSLWVLVGILWLISLTSLGLVLHSDESRKKHSMLRGAVAVLVILALSIDSKLSAAREFPSMLPSVVPAETLTATVRGIQVRADGATVLTVDDRGEILQLKATQNPRDTSIGSPVSFEVGHNGYRRLASGSDPWTVVIVYGAVLWTFGILLGICALVAALAGLVMLISEISSRIQRRLLGGL